MIGCISVRLRALPCEWRWCGDGWEEAVPALLLGPVQRPRARAPGRGRPRDRRRARYARRGDRAAARADPPADGPKGRRGGRLRSRTDQPPGRAARPIAPDAPGGDREHGWRRPPRAARPRRRPRAAREARGGDGGGEPMNVRNDDIPEAGPAKPRRRTVATQALSAY